MKRKKNSIARHENGNKSAYGFLAPYLILFSIFIIIPIIIAIGLSFTSFNTIQAPTFKGFLNYVNLITQDEIFMQYVLPNTIKYALIVGPGGYILAFLIAWALSQLTSVPRTILAIIFYSPSMTGAVAMAVVWKIIFSGDQMGLINNWLMNLGVIDEPIIWLTSAQFLLPIMIIVALWSSMGVGFLAMLAGILNADEELYEAAAIDGVKNRFPERCDRRAALRCEPDPGLCRAAYCKPYRGLRFYPLRDGLCGGSFRSTFADCHGILKSIW